ncbi:MAG: class I SAM-dependent methyltransferase [Gemmataceae bacterium]|nr:class I SAM-dependent methyltransferase [Gemmataceae bacterium]MCI0740575.1 class I SAM-dependent methyltransferase [Gemmataceae bacterium]
MSDAYRADLAYIHNAGFGHFARAAASKLLRELRRIRVSCGLVVDLACGSGILAKQVSEAGFDVLGIDISPAMIALAKKHAPRATFRSESLFHADLPQCLAVTAIGECFNFLFDKTNSKTALAQVLRRIYQALVPGGIVLFDVATPGRVPEGVRRLHVEGDDWAVLVTATEDRRRRLLTRKITSFRKRGDVYRRDFEEHRLRLLSPATLHKELRSIGFQVRPLDRYGKLRFPPGYVGFLARK